MLDKDEIKVPIDNEVLSDEDAKNKNSFEANYEKLYSRILPNADINFNLVFIIIYFQREFK